jgi:hypothetical protein
MTQGVGSFKLTIWYRNEILVGITLDLCLCHKVWEVFKLAICLKETDRYRVFTEMRSQNDYLALRLTCENLGFFRSKFDVLEINFGKRYRGF